MKNLSKKFNYKTVLKILTIFFIIGSLVCIYQNQFFRYAEFHDKVELKVTEGDATVVRTLYDLALTNSNTSRIDRTNEVIYFEHATSSEVETYLKDNFKDLDKIKYQVSEQFFGESNEMILFPYLVSGILIVIASYLGLFFFIYRFSKVFKLFEYLKIYLLLFLSVTVFTIIQLGVLSLLSLFSEVKNIDLLSLYTGVIVLIVYFYFASASFIEQKTFGEFLEEMSLYIKNNAWRFIKLSLAILIILSIGFGINFVVPATLIIISFGASLLSLQWSIWAFQSKVSLKSLRSIRPRKVSLSGIKEWVNLRKLLRSKKQKVLEGSSKKDKPGKEKKHKDKKKKKRKYKK